MAKEPLHETIKKYRIIYVVVILFLIYLTMDVWQFTKIMLPTLTESWQSVPLATAFSTLIGGLFAIAKSASNSVEQDK